LSQRGALETAGPHRKIGKKVIDERLYQAWKASPPTMNDDDYLPTFARKLVELAKARSPEVGEAVRAAFRSRDVKL